jgi:histone H3/H4
MAELVVKKAVKNFAKDHGMRFPDAVVDALDGKLKDLLTKAAERADKNNRKTVMPHDL